MAEKVVPVKPGWKTSEFWLTVAAMLVGLFVASGILPTEHLAMKICGFALAALTSLGYTVSRAGVKKSGDTIIDEPDNG